MDLPAPSLRRIISETLRAMAEPRRLLPTLVLAAALLIAQTWASHDARAGWVGLVVIVATLVVAPTGWRLALELPGSAVVRAIRLGAFVATGVVMIPTVELGLGRTFHLGYQFLTAPTSMLVSLALYVVGGWGLGRDIALESAIDRARTRTRELEQAAEHAQLLAMRSHLDPHFLFNTLNAIAEWCRQDGEVAEKAVLQLASMLRTILEGIRTPLWPLTRELELVHTLFGLHQLRDPGRFQLTWEVPPELSGIEVPPMLLLPLAENAMKHGPSAGHRGVVRFSLAMSGDALRLELENPGRSSGPRPGSSGLPTFERRLQVSYGDAARFELVPLEASTRVVLTLPLRRAEVAA